MTNLFFNTKVKVCVYCVLYVLCTTQNNMTKLTVEGSLGSASGVLVGYGVRNEVGSGLKT